jgi:hypothetical protein
MPQTLVPPTPVSSQALIDYVNASAGVTGYALALSRAALPVLTHPQPWYAGFAGSLVPAKSHALVWINSVLPQMKAVPVAVQNAQSPASGDFASLDAALAALLNAPGDQALIQAAQNAVTDLTTLVLAVQGAVTTFEQAITDFAADLIPDATTLAGFAADAAKTQGADLKDVARLNAAIQNLQDLIAAKTEAYELNNWGKGVIAIFLVVTAATIGWLGGPVVDGLLGMVAIGTLAGVGDKLKSELDIQDQVTEIANIQSELSDVNTEIALLQSTSKQFAALTTQNTTEQEQVKTVEDFWTPSLDWLSQLHTLLPSISQSVTAGNITQAQTDAASAYSLWTQLQDFVTPLTQVQYNLANDTVLLPAAP